MSDPPAPILEALPSVATADPRLVRELAAVLARPPDPRLLRVDVDRERGRTVFTLLGTEAPVLDALVALARRCNELLDLRSHVGLHAPVGHLDLVPLVALSPTDEPKAALGPARRLLERLSAEAGLCCVAYGAASPAGASSSGLRRGGPARLLRRIEAGEVEASAPAGQTAEQRLARGVTCVGIRRSLAELTVELETSELRIGRRIAERLRASTGGLPAVRASAWRLGEGRVRLALRLVDLERTDPATALGWVERLAAEMGTGILRTELSGCIPASAWGESLAARLALEDAGGESAVRLVLENWLPGGRLGDDPGLLAEELPGPAPEPRLEPSPGEATLGDKPPLRLLDLSLAAGGEALLALVEELGEPRYRAQQVLGAVWKHRRRSFDDMNELPKGLRGRLTSRVAVGLLAISERRVSTDGTMKYLWRCPDGAEIESVSIPTERRTTFCLSSQAGCSLKCRFCATGSLGFGRNLSAGEILDQVLGMLADQDLSSESLNVVFMGMGEPGHNLEAVLQAARVLNDPAGLGVGARRITLSTAGVVAAIRSLATEPMQLRLALSLHAASQELRESLMNIAKRHDLDELQESCLAYHDATRRRITLEYCLIPGVNDGVEDARRLARWARKIPSTINLIPYNPVAEFGFEAATPNHCRDFRERVLAEGYPGEVVVRTTRGRDIEAACGMLHRHRAESAGSAGA